MFDPYPVNNLSEVISAVLQVMLTSGGIICLLMAGVELRFGANRKFGHSSPLEMNHRVALPSALA